MILYTSEQKTFQDFFALRLFINLILILFFALGVFFGLGFGS